MVTPNQWRKLQYLSCHVKYLTAFFTEISGKYLIFFTLGPVPETGNVPAPVFSAPSKSKETQKDGVRPCSSPEAPRSGPNPMPSSGTPHPPSAQKADPRTPHTADPQKCMPDGPPRPDVRTEQEENRVKSGNPSPLPADALSPHSARASSMRRRRNPQTEQRTPRGSPLQVRPSRLRQKDRQKPLPKDLQGCQTAPSSPAPMWDGLHPMPENAASLHVPFPIQFPS